MGKFFGCLLPALMATLLAASAKAGPEDPHMFRESECLTCHALVSEGAEKPRRTIGSVTAVCSRCHKKMLTQGYLHPVDVKPQQVFAPKELPLSSTGEITCSTCHNIHGNRFTEYGTLTYYLRGGATGREFCRLCHRGPSRGRSHREIGLAHLGIRRLVEEPSRMIDPLSRECVLCHDGSFASSATVKSPKSLGMWDASQPAMKSHPIGIPYGAARLGIMRKVDLKPISAVEKTIKLPGGKVGCCSCHDPYSTEPKRLVVRDERSRLCLTCHVL